MVINQKMVDNFASLLSCATVGQSLDEMTAPSSICFRTLALLYLSVLGPIVVLSVGFLISVFRSTLSPYLCF